MHRSAAKPCSNPPVSGGCASNHAREPTGGFAAKAKGRGLSPISRLLACLLLAGWCPAEGGCGGGHEAKLMEVVHSLFAVAGRGVG